jgi:O-antigen ligase
MTSAIKGFLITVIPQPDTINLILYALVPLLFAYLWRSSRRFAASVVSMLFILNAMTPIAFKPLLGIKGFQLIYTFWGFALIAVTLKRTSARKPFRLGEFLAWPVALLLLMQLLAWCITLTGGSDHSYYRAGFTRSELVFGYLLSPLQIVLSAWMVMIASEEPEDRAVIERSILISALILGGLVASFYLKMGSLSGGATTLMSGRRAVWEQMGLEINGLSAACVFHYIASVRLKNHGTKWLPAFAIGASLVGIMFTLSRMAWVSTVVVTAMMFPRLKTSAKVALIVCAIGMYFQFHTMIKNRVLYGVNEVYSSEAEKVDKISAGRVSLWDDAWKTVKRNPIIGTGVQTPVKTSWGAAYAFHPHNAYLRVLLDMGFVGLFLVCVCYGYFLIKGWKNGGPLVYCVIALFMMGAFALEFHVHKQNYMIWLLYGLCLNNRPRKGEVPESNRLMPS